MSVKLTIDELKHSDIYELRDAARVDGDVLAEEMARLAIVDLVAGKQWSEAMAWCIDEINARRSGAIREGGEINNI